MSGQASRSIHGNRVGTVRIQEMTGGLSPRPGLRSVSWLISEPSKRIDDGLSGSAVGYSVAAILSSLRAQDPGDGCPDHGELGNHGHFQGADGSRDPAAGGSSGDS